MSKYKENGDFYQIFHFVKLPFKLSTSLNLWDTDLYLSFLFLDK